MALQAHCGGKKFSLLSRIWPVMAYMVFPPLFAPSITDGGLTNRTSALEGDTWDRTYILSVFPSPIPLTIPARMHIDLMPVRMCIDPSMQQHQHTIACALVSITALMPSTASTAATKSYINNDWATQVLAKVVVCAGYVVGMRKTEKTPTKPQQQTKYPPSNRLKQE